MPLARASKEQSPKGYEWLTFAVLAMLDWRKHLLQHILVAAALNLYDAITNWLMDVPRSQTRTAPLVLLARSPA